MDNCDICSEEISYCTCWRCQECEQLFEAQDDPDADCPLCGGEPY